MRNGMKRNMRATIRLISKRVPSAHYKKRTFLPAKEKTRTSHWLMAQGYRLSSLPSRVTWYTIDKVSGQEREFITQVNNYNLNLYRGKGCVLDRKYLNPEAWHELEYGVKPPLLT